ncbi:translin family, DNA-binding protein [Hyperthermus butylicus DSM 5456]|uniref:Translin family, DNA-binding protein n=1 Tax=Hyperthermus butylicus (strain DSM 5456 / JCM 9403 / PLM1-5) TaxID=415426 RepID=A2BK30_HYPBU|nr:translin family, DNA-binding protein [Hyperthermus butylicus DSM 5456]
MPELANFDPQRLAEKFRAILSEINTVLSRREELRDSLIKLGRDVIKLSGWAINALHRGRVEEARKYIEEMDSIVSRFREMAKSDSFLAESGFVYNVLSEYVEAKVFYSVVVEGVIPSHRELSVPEVPYLQGVGDVLGELRRLALDYMRLGRLNEAEKVLDLMEAMYYEMRALEYPDALLPGVRHKVDVARRLIDDTKSLLLSVRARTGYGAS